MSASASTTGRLRRGWNYYRRYTKQQTGIHAAATAALTGFGLLAYFERWFVFVAIASYLFPPVYLYLTGKNLSEPDHGANNDRTYLARSRDRDTDADADGIDADSNADADGVNADSDFDGATVGATDGDADADGIDTDSDSDG